MVQLRNYSTVSLPKKVKEILERDKGESSWGEYLMGLYFEASKKRRLEAFERLRKSLSEEDLRRILEESRSFRREFKLE